jgi:hypothetical protein
VCTDGVSFTWASGETDMQPPATRPVGMPGWVGPIDLLVQSGPRNLPPTETDWFNQPMAGAAVFTAGWAPVHNPTLGWWPYSHDGVVPFRFPLTPLSTKIRIDTQPNGDEATDAFVYVHPCFLFGPIDVDPGQSPNPVDLSLPNRLQVILQRDNGGHHVQRLQPLLEALDFAADNGFGPVRLFLPIRNMRRDCLLQIVDVVNKNSVELVHPRIDISRNRNVDKKHRPVLPPCQK